MIHVFEMHAVMVHVADFVLLSDLGLGVGLDDAVQKHPGEFAQFGEAVDLVVECHAVDHAPRGFLAFREIVLLPFGDVDEATTVLEIVENR